MANIYDVHAYKGGVGVTTTATALAVQLAHEGHRTLLVSFDDNGDALSLLALSAGNGVTPLLDLLDYVNGPFGPYAFRYDDIVVDNGRYTHSAFPEGNNVFRVCVVRNDYISLKNSVNKGYDILVAFCDATNCLNERDIASALVTNPVVVPIDPAIQRVHDAGLFLSREETYKWAKKIIPDYD